MGMLAATEEVVTSIPEALVNTVIGMGTVFVVLILISFIIYLLKFVPSLLDRSKKEEIVVRSENAAPSAPAAKPAEKPAPVVSGNTDDTQLVAVITAAITAAMEQEGTPVAADGLVIRSIKKRI